MSQSILKRTISAVDDKRLVLANGEALRNLAYLNNWTTVRIGLQISCELSAAISGTPQLAFGLSAGASHGFGDPVTTHFVGARPTATSATFGGTAPHYTQLTAWKPCKKVSGTITDGAAFTGVTTATIPKASDLVRQIVIVQVTKGSPNFTVQIVALTNATPIATDMTDTLFVNAMQAADMAGAAAALDGSGYYAASSVVSVAVDEATNGNLDSVDVFWDRTSTPMEISSIRHRKVA